MNAEQLQDAISLLPEEMLHDVDQLRQRKPAPWKGLLAAAACFALLAGLWVLGDSGIKAASGSTAPDRYFSNSQNGMGADSAESSEAIRLIATILEVQDDRIIVVPGESLVTDEAPITVMLTGLEDISHLQFSRGDRIYIYYHEKADPLIPYDIAYVLYD